MAHLFRLIALLAVTMLCGVAQAAIPKVAWEFRGATSDPWVPSPEVACSNLAASTNAGGGNSVYTFLYVESFGVSSKLCHFKVTNRTTGAVISQDTGVGLSSRSVTPYCPANSTVSGSACTCNSGYAENATQTGCRVVTAPEKWAAWCQAAVGQSLGPMTSPGRSVDGGCLGDINIAGSPIDTPGYSSGDVPAGGGCSYSFDEKLSYQDDTEAWQTKGTAVANGGTCMQGNTPIPTDAPPNTEQAPAGAKDPCPNGFPGTVNGTSVCADREPDKGIEGVKGTTTTNADGTSTTTQETTKCNAGKCTTTRTTTNRDAAGNVVGTPTVTQTTQSIGDKCNADPGSKLCAEVGMGNGEGGAGFSGNCVAGFVVKGEDPIQNAMALEQHKRNCEAMRTDTEPSTWVTAEGAKTDNAMKDNPNNGTVSIGPGNFDTSDALGGGGCNLNKTVTVRGYSVALPFNVLCDPLAVLGNILVAVSLLLAARILTRG
ncbi:hypothetical protein J7E49_26655 [Variovorax paradoxus]|nr:hypothetical protein [Variovorax paradoxus]